MPGYINKQYVVYYDTGKNNSAHRIYEISQVSLVALKDELSPVPEAARSSG
ncbi:MAG: hypothetical protein OQK98_03920 [Gammaproteobacteria bacterium]|nr:hypothetical protein [Gammaproteobacteria bacterium]